MIREINYRLLIANRILGEQIHIDQRDGIMPYYRAIVALEWSDWCWQRRYTLPMCILFRAPVAPRIDSRTSEPLKCLFQRDVSWSAAPPQVTTSTGGNVSSRTTILRVICFVQLFSATTPHICLSNRTKEVIQSLCYRFAFEAEGYWCCWGDIGGRTHAWAFHRNMYRFLRWLNSPAEFLGVPRPSTKAIYFFPKCLSSI